MEITLLPIEILENIFSFCLRYELYNYSCVCKLFRSAVHHMAVLRLRHLYLSSRVQRSQLLRIGWKEEQHEINSCSCIDIAFRSKPFGGGGGVEGASSSYFRPNMDDRASIDCTTALEGVAFTALQSVNSTEVRAFPRNLFIEGTVAHKDSSTVTSFSPPVAVHMYSRGSTLLLLLTQQETQRMIENSFQIRIYDVRTTVSQIEDLNEKGKYCEDFPSYQLNFTQHIPGTAPECYVVSDIALTERSLAVHLFSEANALPSYTLFYKIDVMHPGVPAEFRRCILNNNKMYEGEDTFLDSGFICLNDKYFVIQYLDNAGKGQLATAVAVYRRCRLTDTELFPENIVTLKRKGKGLRKYQEDNLYLEGGSSDYLVSYEVYTASLFLIQLKRAQVLREINLSGGRLIPCNWVGGVFILLQVVELEAEEKKFIVQILDPESISSSRQETCSAEGISWDTAVPASWDTVVPASWDTAVPASWDTTVPASLDAAVPASWDTTVPASWDTAVPGSRDTAVPASWDTAVPANWDTTVPASWDTAVPARWDTAVPASWNTAVPASWNTAVPASWDTAVPAIWDIAVPSNLAQPWDKSTIEPVKSASSHVTDCSAATSCGYPAVKTATGWGYPAQRAASYKNILPPVLLQGRQFRTCENFEIRFPGDKIVLADLANSLVEDSDQEEELEQELEEGEEEEEEEVRIVVYGRAETLDTTAYIDYQGLVIANSKKIFFSPCV